MDISNVEKSTKTNDPTSSSISVLRKDVLIEVQDISDSVCRDAGKVELMSTTSSDSDIGTVDSSSPIEFSRESIRTALCKSNAFGYDNGNESNPPTKAEKDDAELDLFNVFEGDVNGKTPPLAPTMNRSPSVQGNFSSSEASASDLELLDYPMVFTNDNEILGPNIDRDIAKQYSPSLNRISDELNRLRQSPVNENHWEFLQSDVGFSTAAGRRPSSYVPRNRAHHSTYSVGIQVNNPEIGYFIHRNTHGDWIRCMMCAVIVACIITGLCAATVMILNTFFQYWLLP